MAIFTKIYPFFAIAWCLYATYKHIKNPRYKNTFDAIFQTVALNLFLTPIMMIVFFYNKHRQVEWLKDE